MGRPRRFSRVTSLGLRSRYVTAGATTLTPQGTESTGNDDPGARAAAMQALLLPPRGKLMHAGFEYCGLVAAASQMGGDWWQHYPLTDERLLLCVGDVTGHGIVSAMLTLSVKAACDRMLVAGGEVELGELMSSLDDVVRDAGRGDLVMTLFAAILDRKHMAIEYANAGHNFPMLVRGNSVLSLVAHGRRLGDGTAFTPARTPLEPRDLIVFYTDGIIECRNATGESYGGRRLRKAAQACAGRDAVVARDAMLTAAHRFYGGTPPDDDITLVVCTA